MSSGNNSGAAAMAISGSTAAAASLAYIYYCSKKAYKSKTLWKYMNVNQNGNDLDTSQHSSDSDSGLSYDGGAGIGIVGIGNGHGPDATLDRQEESMRFIPANPSLGSYTMDMDEDADLSFRDKQKNDNDVNQSCIYLDYNGTTPIDQRVVAAMLPFLTTHFGNPSSSHHYGSVPKQAIALARRAILGLLYPNQMSRCRLKSEQDGVVFTGCGTEADNLAIWLGLECFRLRQMRMKQKKMKQEASTNIGTTSSTSTSASAKDNGSVSSGSMGSVFGFGKDKRKEKEQTHTTEIIPHIVTSNVEHPAIAQYLQSLERQSKIAVTYVPVTTDGSVTASSMIHAIDHPPPGSETVLVTLMLANNESGALQPVKEVAEYCQEWNENHSGEGRRILFHTDAAQAVGKVSIAMDETGLLGDGVDLVTIVGHKFGAPKGVACLYIRPGCLVDMEGGDNEDDDGEEEEDAEKGNYLLLGGGQEGGRRAGTENVPYIVALGTAAGLLTAKNKYRQYRWMRNATRMESMRTRLLQNLTEALGDSIVRPNGPSESSRRLPNTLSVGLRGVQSGELLQKIRNLVACSAGSACHSSGCAGKVSAVLEAMDVPMEYARGTLRLSVGPDTTQDDVDLASKIIVKEVKLQLHLDTVNNGDDNADK